MIIESVLTEAQCKAPHTSAVYNELLDYVKTHFPLTENTTATQAAIFSLAYTLSCRTKKIRIDSIYKLGTTPEEKRENDIAISAIISGLRGTNEYEMLCTEAQRLFSALRNEAYKRVLNDIDTTLSARIAPLSDSIGKISAKRPEVFWKKLLKFILVDSPKHAALLIFGGFWLTALAWGVSTVAPHFANTAFNVVEEAFRPFIKDEKSKSAPSNH